VINTFKHAFAGRAAGRLVVTYEVAETNWRLAVFNNGIGTPEGQLNLDRSTPGLGTIIVEALAKQLDARVEVARNPYNMARWCRSPTERQIAAGLPRPAPVDALSRN
jgi:two-component sensor histidine kinase